MTTINPAAATTAASPVKTGLGALGQGDFLRLMTVQMQQQDPFDPVDQKEMLAQMAQFSALAGTAEMGETLKAIAGKLDAVLVAQEATLAAVERNAAAQAASDTTQTTTQET